MSLELKIKRSGNIFKNNDHKQNEDLYLEKDWG